MLSNQPLGLLFRILMKVYNSLLITLYSPFFKKEIVKLKYYMASRIRAVRALAACKHCSFPFGDPRVYRRAYHKTVWAVPGVYLTAKSQPSGIRRRCARV
jgi:hypothetical protein